MCLFRYFCCFAKKSKTGSTTIELPKKGKKSLLRSTSLTPHSMAPIPLLSDYE